jgi:hypothetical protein
MSRGAAVLSRRRVATLLFLFFGSGAAALIYQVLWLKELGRLFGVSSHAAATTLARRPSWRGSRTSTSPMP